MPIIEQLCTKIQLNKEFNRLNRLYKQKMIDWWDTKDEATGRQADVLFAHMSIISEELLRRRREEKPSREFKWWGKKPLS